MVGVMTEAPGSANAAGRPLRLLVLLPTLNGGGAERAVVNLLSAIDRSRFEPILLLIKNEGVYWDLLPAALEVQTILPPGTRIRDRFPAVLSALLKAARSADLIVGALELTVTYYAALLGRLLGKPSVGWVHTDLGLYLPQAGALHPLLCRLFYPQLDMVIAVSDGVAASLHSLLPAIRDKIRIIHNSLPIDAITQAAQQEPEVVVDGPYVVGVSRLNEEKGCDLLIRAFALLKDQCPKLTLVILGDGPERHRLEQLVHELGLVGRVRLPGFLQNPYAVMQRARVFAMSSRFEGFGMVLIEALALGVPVVSMDSPGGGPAEVLRKGGGLLVPFGDLEAFAKALCGVARQEMQIEPGGIERAGDFSTETVIPRFQSALQTVVDR